MGNLDELHLSHIKLVASGVDPSRVQDVKEALTLVWAFDEWELDGLTLTGKGEDWMLIDVEEIIYELASEAVRASQAAIEVEVHVRSSIETVRRWEA